MLICSCGAVYAAEDALHGSCPECGSDDAVPAQRCNECCEWFPDTSPEIYSGLCCSCARELYDDRLGKLYLASLGTEYLRDFRTSGDTLKDYVLSDVSAWIDFLQTKGARYHG